MKALEFVEDLVKVKKKRVVFVMNHIDSAQDDRWKRYLSFLCLFDEFSTELYVESIRAAHVGKLLKNLAWGTVTFGYRGIEIPDSNNRKGKPIRRIEVEENSASIVRQVFEWFANDGISIKSIIQKLNSDPSIPRPPKSKNGQWTYLAVKTLLTNKRYLGEWSYGVKEAVLVTDKDYIRQLERDEPLSTYREEKLRIVPDDIFYRAQQRLAENYDVHSRKRRADSTKTTRQPLKLNGLFVCPEHNQPLYVAGAHGQYLLCPQCQRLPAEDRKLYSQLNRVTALKCLSKALVKAIEDDQQLTELVIDSCQQEVENLQRPDSELVAQLKRRRETLLRSIRMLTRQEPESDSEEKELESALREKRQSLADAEYNIARLELADQQSIRVPSPDEVTQVLNDLPELIRRCSDEDSSVELDEACELFRQLTGGRIELFQCGARKAQQGWLQGRFQAPLVKSIAENATKNTISKDHSRRFSSLIHQDICESLEYLVTLIRSQFP